MPLIQHLDVPSTTCDTIAGHQIGAWMPHTRQPASRPSTGPTAEATSALPGTGSGPGDTPPSVRSEAGSSGAQLSSHDTSLTFNVGTSVDGKLSSTASR
ncbi:hypothetical protein WJX72_004695 [[Myrmecia] bisecta]|uniref:Uncharacterized protein n=1 Tax=[Myrmecia] bisecta TaxID=41462 RepID=A0AAW1PSZ6_9CHLO